MSQPELQRLLPRHYEILNLSLGGNGPKEIAQVLGMTPQAISLITKSPVFQNELARRRDGINAEVDAGLASSPLRAKELLESSAHRAAEVQVELLESPDHKTKLASSKEILDRVLGSGKEHQASSVVVLQKVDIQLLQLALRESEASDGSEGR